MEKHPPHRHSVSNSVTVWDCGSALYDSFELRSFEKQLDSAINSGRTLSMPHLPDRRVAPDPAPSNTAPLQHPPKNNRATSSRISKSVQRFFKSVFVKATSSGGGNKQQKEEDKKQRVYFVYEKTGGLCTIPEGPESDGFGLSSNIKSLAKRSASERFTAATAVGVSSCA
ncbi:unnamed protein product [Linum tenue]|uniref:Uncharacterized protein n=1 Tax=Linum tenue TaxID=586396 RepID=A0AAV0M6D2_9ROSI|nr:unnamed protein product [Linum tenue]